MSVPRLNSRVRFTRPGADFHSPTVHLGTVARHDGGGRFLLRLDGADGAFLHSSAFGLCRITECQELHPAVSARVSVRLEGSKAWKPGRVQTLLQPEPRVLIVMDGGRDEGVEVDSAVFAIFGAEWVYAEGPGMGAGDSEAPMAAEPMPAEALATAVVRLEAGVGPPPSATDTATTATATATATAIATHAKVASKAGMARTPSAREDAAAAAVRARDAKATLACTTADGSGEAAPSPEVRGAPGADLSSAMMGGGADDEAGETETVSDDGRGRSMQSGADCREGISCVESFLMEALRAGQAGGVGATEPGASASGVHQGGEAGSGKVLPPGVQLLTGQTKGGVPPGSASPAEGAGVGDITAEQDDLLASQPAEAAAVVASPQMQHRVSVVLAGVPVTPSWTGGVVLQPPNAVAVFAASQQFCGTKALNAGQTGAPGAIGPGAPGAIGPGAPASGVHQGGEAGGGKVVPPGVQPPTGQSNGGVPPGSASLAEGSGAGDITAEQDEFLAAQPAEAGAVVASTQMQHRVSVVPAGVPVTPTGTGGVVMQPPNAVAVSAASQPPTLQQSANVAVPVVQGSAQLARLTTAGEGWVAAKLGKNVDKFRDDYMAGLFLSNKEIRQRSVAMYLIDKLAFRVSKEKIFTGTPGCCSLRVKHLKFIEPRSVAFDFSDKDSWSRTPVRYFRVVEVEKQVYISLCRFVRDKGQDDYVFPWITARSLNSYLKYLMPD